MWVIMNEKFKQSVRRITYTISYFASLCNWLAAALTSIPEYKPPEGKSVNADFADSESQRSSGTND